MSRTKEENDKIRAAVEDERLKNKNRALGFLGYAGAVAGTFVSMAGFGAYTVYNAPLNEFQSLIALTLVLGAFAFTMLLSQVTVWLNEMERQGKI